MMKRKEKALIIFMIVMVVFGALLPQSVLSFMNRKTELRTERKEIERINFNNSSSLMDSLKLISGSYTEYRIKNNDLNFTSKEIFKKNKELIKELGKYFKSVKLEGISSHRESPVFIISDSGYNRVYDQEKEQEVVLIKSTIWKCSITAKNGAEWSIYIDDSTGIMVRMVFYDPDSYKVHQRDMDGYYEKFLDFCRGYYDFEVLASDYKIYTKPSDSVAIDETGEYLILKDKTNKESAEIMLYVDNGIMQFNM